MARQLRHEAPLDAARRTLVRDIMTRDPITVGPDAGLEPIIELFVARNIGHIPVVDDAGRALGMISKTDVVREIHLRGDTHIEQDPGTRSQAAHYGFSTTHVHEVDDLARDVMTPIVMWVPESASVAEAAQVIASGQMHAVVVAEDDGRVTGILSSVDIVAWVAGAERRIEG